MLIKYATKYTAHVARLPLQSRELLGLFGVAADCDEVGGGVTVVGVIGAPVAGGSGSDTIGGVGAVGGEGEFCAKAAIGRNTETIAATAKIFL